MEEICRIAAEFEAFVALPELVALLQRIRPN